MGDGRQWHLDRRVPVALLIGLLAQAGAAVWWASATSDRLSHVEQRLEGVAARSEALESEVNQQSVTLAVVATRLDDTNQNLDLVRSEIATTNRLLRELLGNGGRPQ